MISIYLSGPITHGDPERNVIVAFEMCNRLLDLGVAVYCPHYSYYLDKLKTRPYEDWLTIDLKWVAVCDGFYRMEGYSPGADKEEQWAFELGKPIFKSLSEVKRWLSN